MPRYKPYRGRTVVKQPYSRQSVSRLASQYRRTVVKKGENIKELAKRLGTTEQELVRQNKKLYSYKAGAVVKVKKAKATGTKWRKKALLKEMPETPIYTGPYAPGYQAPAPAPAPERERLGQVGTWISNYEAITGRPATFDLGRRRITTTRPMQYTGYAEAYAQQPPRGAAPPEALRPDITGSMTEETYNRVWYQSARYIADQFRFAFGLEDDVEYFEMLPTVVPSRFVTEMQMTAADMERMGYDRIGNWWRKRKLSDMLLLEEITPSPEEVTGGAGYGGYGGAGRGGYGYGGAGGGAGGAGRAATPKSQTFPRGLYPNITLGHFMRSIAGRQYSPEFGGMIHWRL